MTVNVESSSLPLSYNVHSIQKHCRSFASFHSVPHKEHTQLLWLKETMTSQHTCQNDPQKILQIIGKANIPVLNWAPRRCTGKWRHSSRHSYLGNRWSGLFHALTILPPWKEATGTHWIGDWVVPKPVWMLWRRAQSWPLMGLKSWFQGNPACTLVTTLTKPVNSCGKFCYLTLITYLLLSIADTSTSLCKKIFLIHTFITGFWPCSVLSSPTVCLYSQNVNVTCTQENSFS
jgi:hypothetical protein